MSIDPKAIQAQAAVMTLSNREQNKCPFCAAMPSETCSVRDYTGNGELSIAECKPCGIAWQWPLAWSVAQGTAFFDEGYDRHGETRETYFDVVQRGDVARLQMNFVAATCPTGGTILDVGAGIGAFVKEAASRGWDAVGIELSHAAAQAAQATGVNVQQTRLDDLPVEHLFDAISLWDVIEHVEDPAAILEASFKRLKPGGWLFMETGNYQSASLAASGAQWWLWQADHRWYFSPQSLGALLRGVGFSRVDLASSTFRPAYNANREPKSSPIMLLKAIVRRPLKMRQTMSRHRAIRHSWAKWPAWAHLPIFALAARKAVS